MPWAIAGAGKLPADATAAVAASSISRRRILIAASSVSYGKSGCIKSIGIVIARSPQGNEAIPGPRPDLREIASLRSQ